MLELYKNKNKTCANEACVVSLKQSYLILRKGNKNIWNLNLKDKFCYIVGNMCFSVFVLYNLLLSTCEYSGMFRKGKSLL